MSSPPQFVQPYLSMSYCKYCPKFIWQLSETGSLDGLNFLEPCFVHWKPLHCQAVFCPVFWQIVSKMFLGKMLNCLGSTQCYQKLSRLNMRCLTSIYWHIAEFSFNFNYILVESWDSLILSFNTHPPTTTRQTEKVVNHATSEHLLPSKTSTSTTTWIEITITLEFLNHPPTQPKK